MSDIRLPGELARDGYQVLDIQSSLIEFPEYDATYGRTYAPLPVDSQIAIGNSPEGLLTDVRDVPNPESPDEPIKMPVLVPGFASIDVVLGRGESDSAPSGLTLASLNAGLADGSLVRSGLTARLLHPFTKEGVYAAFVEGLSDQVTIGQQLVNTRNYEVMRSVVATSPSLIDGRRTAEPRFVTTVPLTQDNPGDPLVETDIYLQVARREGVTVPPHVRIGNVEEDYNQDDFARVIVGSIGFRSPHPLSPDRTLIDYQRLPWQIEALPARWPDGDTMEPEQLPKVMGLIVTTSSIDITVMRTPGRGGEGTAIAGVRNDDAAVIYGDFGSASAG